jgi:thiol-disulfide isomerase/thioredoxin
LSARAAQSTAPADVDWETAVRLTVLFLGLLALPACDRQPPEPAPAEDQATAGATAAIKGVHRDHAGKPAPDVTFHDPDGGDIRLADFTGVPVLVNLWASWCAPCIRELPTLAKLAQSHARDGQLGVIAVSQDMAPKASVDAFLAGRKIGRFAAFHDPEMALSAALGVEVMPTTVLYDRQGREVWRYVGDLDWTGAEAARLLAEAGAGAAPAAVPSR